MDEATYRSLDLLMKFAAGIIAYGSAFIAYGNLKTQLDKNREERAAVTQQRADDLGWRRAQFLIELWRDFNADRSLRPCIKLVDAGDQDSRLATVLQTQPWNLSDSDAEIRYDFDRYFDILQSLAYCEEKRTLTLDEVACFGWHFQKILESRVLTDYCSQGGYRNVVELAKRA